MRPNDEVTQISEGIRAWVNDDRATARVQECTATEFAEWYGKQVRVLASVESDVIRDDLIGSINRALGRRKQPAARWKADIRAFRAAQAAAARPAAATSVDGHVVANFRTAVEVDDEGKAKTVRYEVPQGVLVSAIHAATGDWPRTSGGLLFAAQVPEPGVVAGKEHIQLLPAPDVLFAWLRKEGVTVEWTGKEVRCEGRQGGRAPLGRGEAYQAAKMLAPYRYDALELLPHWPMIPGLYYVSRELPDGDGEALRQFVALLNPETEEDRQFMEAAILTPGWGGEPGARPGFVFTSDHGVGAGKTATAETIAEVWGGFVAIQPEDDWGKACERLLSDNALEKRVVMVDNLKGRLSSASFEGAITSRVINGRRMYHGDYERPNVLTWFLTVNVAELSRDLAARCIVVRVGKPKHAVNFKGAVSEFLAAHRYALLCDIMTRLKEPPKCAISTANRDRWQAWQDAVLTRFDNGDDLAALAKARRPAVDADANEAQDVSDALEGLIRSKGHCPNCTTVWIPTKDAMDAIADIKACKTTTAFKQWLKPMTQQPALSHIAASKRLNGAGLSGVGWSKTTADGPQKSINFAPGICVCNHTSGLKPSEGCEGCEDFLYGEGRKNKNADYKNDRDVGGVSYGNPSHPSHPSHDDLGRDPSGGWSKKP